MQSSRSTGPQIARRWAVMLIAAAAAPLAWAASADATIHLWVIEEAYSDASGEVQYVQMHQTPATNFENLFGGATLASDGESFIFPADRPTDTAGRRLLLGTGGFAQAAGAVDIDYLLPANFFDPAGDTLSFGAPGFGTISTLSFGPGDFPTDGVNALHYINGVTLNAPTNWDGDVGFVPEPTTASLVLIGGALTLLGRRRGCRAPA